MQACYRVTEVNSPPQRVSGDTRAVCQQSTFSGSGVPMVLKTLRTVVKKQLVAPSELVAELSAVAAEAGLCPAGGWAEDSKQWRSVWSAICQVGGWPCCFRIQRQLQPRLSSCGVAVSAGWNVQLYIALFMCTPCCAVVGVISMQRVVNLCLVLVRRICSLRRRS